jgi:uncharacterized protein (TIGR02145 family)
MILSTMNRFFLFISAILTCLTLAGQPPVGISHQAVMRNSEGELISNSTIGIKVSILKNSPDGPAIYSEFHFPVTDSNGHISYIIGHGTEATGNFNEINWQQGSFFLKTEIDFQGARNYSLSGVSEFFSVPYALYSLSSDDDFKGNMQGNRIFNLADPQLLTDATPKKYVDSLKTLLLNRIIILENAFGVTVTDIEGNIYPTAVIGTQVWMGKNLRVTKYNNGDPIQTGLGNHDWANTTDGAFSLIPHSSVPQFNNNEDVLEAYGALYNWYAVNDSRGLCPAGWKVASDADWTQLTDYLIANYDDITVNNVGKKLKSCRQAGSPLGGECDTNIHPRWDFNATHFGTDDFGFGALPGVHRDYTGPSFAPGWFGFWWTSTLHSQGRARTRDIGPTDGAPGAYHNVFNYGFSVRCIKE